MKPVMVGEDETSFTMHDGDSSFVVPKKGLSEKMRAEIRASKPDGGAGPGVGEAVPVRLPPPLKTYGALEKSWGGAEPLPPLQPPGQPPAGYEKPIGQSEEEKPYIPPAAPEQMNYYQLPAGVGAEELARRAEEWKRDPQRWTRDPLSEIIANATLKEARPAEQAKQLGVAPRGGSSSPAVPEPPPAIPSKPVTATGGVGGAYMPGTKDIQGGIEAQRKAAQLRGEIESEKARQTAEALGAFETQLKQNALDEKRRTDEARLRTDETMSGLRRAQDEMRNIDTTVDPGRFWASRSTEGKVLAVLGLAMGSFGAGADGINRSAQMLNNAVDRDIEAQKAEYALRLQKGKASVDAAQSAYAMAHQRFGDELAASNAAKATLLGLAENKLRMISASAADPAAIAQADALAGQLRTQKGQLENQAADTAFDNITKRMMAQAQLAAATAKPAAGAEMKEVREAQTAAATMEQTVSQLKGLIQKTGPITEKVGPDSARMETLAGELVLQIKNAEQLGALDKGASELAEKIIGDPTATFTLDATKLAKLDQLLAQAKLRAATMAQTQSARSR